ncbi:MAG: polyphenol oxidase family protein [Candidatus Peribacteraceae bacterium]
MFLSPFPFLRSHHKRFSVGLFTKEDFSVSNEEIGQLLKANGVAALSQVHGNKAVIVREPVARTVEADALATDMPGLALTIRTADCQSFLVFAPEKNIIGLIHAGWKGLQAGIISSFFDLLWEEWGIRAEETIVAAGPSLCKVHGEFTDPKTELKGINPRFFEGRLVDLRTIAEDQLFAVGVDPGRFERHPDCTQCHPEKYWTYRGGHREEVIAGSTNVLACVLLP